MVNISFFKKFDEAKEREVAEALIKKRQSLETKSLIKDIQNEERERIKILEKNLRPSIQFKKYFLMFFSFLKKLKAEHQEYKESVRDDDNPWKQEASIDTKGNPWRRA